MVEMSQRCHNFILIAFKELLNIVEIAMLSLSYRCYLDSRYEFNSALNILGRNVFGPLLPSRMDVRKHQLTG